jgi:3-phosphoshikimate 1-carboxyvinyltransferase
VEELALQPIGPPDVTVGIPGSKSLTNRALVCAALARGTTRLSDVLRSDDTEAMMEGLRRLGAEIWEEEELVVRGVEGRFAIPLHPLDCRASGTTMRFLTACAALVPGRVTLDGSPRMRERPIQELADALGALGVHVKTSAGFPPVTVQGGGISGGPIALDARRSSQFLSAVLLIAPYADRDVEITTGPIASRPYVDMTLETMRAFGASIEVAGDRVLRIPGRQCYRSRRYIVEPDATSAGYFFAAAAVTGGRVRVEGLNAASPQGDVRFVEILERMGCSVERGSRWIAVRGSPYLHGIDVDLNDMPDVAQTLAVVACFARGPTRIRNVGQIRLHETDRMDGLRRELTKLGAQVEIEGSDLRIEPPEQVRPAKIATYDDHRMAMSFAVAGLRAAGIVIENPGCVSKTFPDFFDRLRLLTA